jgi:hypothetical protein
MLRADPAVRTRDAQQSVLGFPLLDLQNALMLEWKLATMLQWLMDDMHAAAPARQMNVALAVNLARHSARGWDNPALPDDFAAIQKLLNLPESDVRERVARVAVQAGNGRDWYHLDTPQTPSGGDG